MRYVLVENGAIINSIQYDEAAIDALQQPYSDALGGWNILCASYNEAINAWSAAYSERNDEIGAWLYEQRVTGIAPERPRPQPYGEPVPVNPGNPPHPPLTRYAPPEGVTMFASDVGEIGDTWPLDNSA